MRWDYNRISCRTKLGKLKSKMPATNGSLFSIFVIVLLILTFFLLTFSTTPLLAITTYFIQQPVLSPPIFMASRANATTTQNRKLPNFLFSISSCKWRREIETKESKRRIYLVEIKCDTGKRILFSDSLEECRFRGPHKNKSSGAYDGISTDDK